MSTSSDQPILDLTRDDHAYFFGFLQTDGHHQGYPGRKGGSVRINLAERDVDILYKLQELIEPIYSSISSRTCTTQYAPRGFQVATWIVCNYALRQELLRLGLPTGSKATVVGPPVGPFDRRGYLRGLIDGDGSVGLGKTGPVIAFCSASSSLMTYFCEMVEEVTGVPRKVSYHEKRRMYGNSITGEPAVVFAEWLYPQGCLALDRKMRSAERVKRWTREPGRRPYRRHRAWTADADAIVLSMSAAEAAVALGRSESAVGWRRGELKRAGKDLVTVRSAIWTPEEDALVAALPFEDAVRQLGRTYASVGCRRSILRKRGVEIAFMRVSPSR